MRRGHPGIGGWRNENPRHYRPRGGGAPHYRPSRGFGHPDSIRFPPPASRGALSGPPPYIQHRPPPPIIVEPEHHERNQYRGNHRYNNPQRPYKPPFYNHGQSSALYHRVRNTNVPDHNPYNEPSKYFDDGIQDTECYNSREDVNERQPVYRPQRRNSLHLRPWSNTVTYFEERGPTKPYKQHDSGDINNFPMNTGHRPPSSDHYGGNSGPASDNSNTFSRSVDDTVDIVRKRLLNRESQHPLDNPPDQDDDVDHAEHTTSSYTNFSTQQEQPMKRRIQRQRQEVKSNCNKIKNKIVHQLFKMDKDKIHKLMDNPNSSDKFEYAISSLITESQNSYNRHLRSVAEKSLCSSSTEFIHNDNNTIYEDTFMKQMQCILDPQDTVLLEDIKPMVLAELCKVLQLHDFDQTVDDPNPYSSLEEPPRFEDFGNSYEHDPFFSPSNDGNSYFEQAPLKTDVEGSDKPLFNSQPNSSSQNKTEVQYQPKPLFERRPNRKCDDFSGVETNTISEMDRRRQERRSNDKNHNEHEFRSPLPLFDSNASQLSEEDDPFAELDQQYHVAVDPSFIASDDLLFQQSPVTNNITDSQREITEKSHTEEPLKMFKTPDKRSKNVKNPDYKTHDIKSPNIPPYKIEKEIGEQLQNIAKSPLKFVSTDNNINEVKLLNNEMKQELLMSDSDISTNSTPVKQHDNTEQKVSDSSVERKVLDNSNIKQRHQQIPEPKVVLETTEISENSSCMIKSSMFSNTRKRSIDQRPSHRKEKRKKIESGLTETNKQILNKNIIINVNDCAGKSSEKCDTSKSVFNLFFSKENEDMTESKKLDSGEKGYSDKYVKRKENLKKQRESEAKKKHDSISSSHSNKSPSDSSTTSAKCPPPPKPDGKSKLKSIDMFGELLQKKSSSHHAHRNTAMALQSSNKTSIDVKRNPVVQISRKLIRRHTGSQYDIVNLTKETETQTVKNCSSKLVQTNRKKLVSRGVQTDLVSKTKTSDTFEPLPKFQSKVQATDTIERMKEIDVEIQILIQEKFKLYSSLESKEPSASGTMQSLGMAVLNVSPFEEQRDINTLSEETMVEDFANIAVEELEKFALESVQEETQKLALQDVQGEDQKLILKSIPEESRKLELKNVKEEKNKPSFKHAKDDSYKSSSKSIRKTKRKSTSGRNKGKHQTSALDTDNNLDIQSTNFAMKRQRQILVYPDMKRSESKTTKRANIKKKSNSKPPNISLIEQIITDDRPLEDIISLEDLEDPVTETPSVKNKNKSRNSQPKSKKKGSKKVRTNKDKHYLSLYDIKKSYVRLLRQDFSKYIRPKSEVTTKSEVGPISEVRIKSEVEVKSEVAPQSEVLTEIEISDASEAAIEPENTIVDDSVLNDVQFDMLDVSEDIIIGDLCEVKTEKDANDSSSVLVSEDIILDNSQSSLEDITGGDVAPCGGECKLYDYSTNETLRRDALTVVGNGDAVLAIECVDHEFIAACLDGNVYHFSVDGKLLNTLRGSNLAVTCLTIVKEKFCTTVYTGSLDSRIRYYDLETGLEKGPECNVLSPIQTMDLAWDTIFVGTRTGYVLQFECKNNMLIPVSTVKFADQSILALRAMKEGPRKVLLVAARSEAVTVKDAQTGLLLRSLEGPKMTVYTILFEDGKVYCGTSSHNIHVFDYASGSHVGSHEGGKGAVCLRALGGLVFAGCYDGCVYVYREGEPRALAQLRGPSTMLLSLAIVGAKIIAGYKDRSLYIWKIPSDILQEMVL